MAEKLEELDIKNIKLLEYTIVGKGFIKFDDEELSFFEKRSWKLFVTRVGWKITDKQKDNIHGECLIQFFPSTKEKIIQSSKKTNKTLLMENIIEPLFFIKYDNHLNIELIDGNKEEIPKEVFFLVLCR